MHKKTYVLVVMIPPEHQHEAVLQAQAIVACLDTIALVFFYAEGVRILQSESSIAYVQQNAWRDFAKAYATPCVVCQTALQRRNIDILHTSDNAIVGGSLGQLMLALEKADEVLVFSEKLHAKHTDCL